jgi:hypothetical protein
LMIRKRYGNKSAKRTVFSVRTTYSQMQEIQTYCGKMRTCIYYTVYSIIYNTVK